MIDGNYSAVRPIVWARADTVVWLDLPKRTVMRQIIWRTLRRAARQELWNGNRERWRNFFSLDPEESVIAWAWHKHGEYRAEYAPPRPTRPTPTWPSSASPAAGTSIASSPSGSATPTPARLIPDLTGWAGKAMRRLVLTDAGHTRLPVGISMAGT